MFIVGVLPAIVYGVLAARLPESPRHLVAAEEPMRRQRSCVGTSVGDVEHRIAEIQRTIGRERRTSVRDLLGGRFGLLPIVWIGIALSMFQQLVGINVIFYYSTQLWSFGRVQRVGCPPDRRDHVRDEHRDHHRRHPRHRSHRPSTPAADRIGRDEPGARHDGRDVAGAVVQGDSVTLEAPEARWR